MPSSNLNSPVAVEEQFQRLQSNLSVIQNNRHKIIYLIDFFNLLSQKGNPLLNQSYYQELLPYFLEQVTEEALLFHPLDHLVKLKDILASFRAACPEESDSADFQRAVKTVNRSLAKTCFYLGKWGKGLTYFWPEYFSEENVDLSIVIKKSGDISPLERFEGYLSAFSQNEGVPSDIYEDLQQIGNDWRQMLDGLQEDCIRTILIDQIPETGDIQDQLSLGIIQPLSLKLTVRPKDSDEDLILFNNRTLSFYDLIHQQAQDALTAAKNIFIHDALRNMPFYKMLYSFPDKASFYTGDSIGMAMGLLSLAAMSFLDTWRYRYKLRQEVAVTGPLDMQGNVRSINDRALKTKLETVFFSPYESVVLPARNCESAETIIKELNNTYRQRSLKIVCVETLSDCINESAVVHKETIPLGDKITKKTKRTVTAGIAAIVLLILIGVNFLSNRDMNPSRLEVKGRILKVYNAADRELWQYEFKSELVNGEKYNAIAGAAHRFTIIEDLDGDGRLEIVIGITGNKNKEIDGTIFYFKSDGTLVWQFQDHPRMTFGDEVMDDLYYAGYLLHHDFKGDGESELVAVFNNHPWYPSRLAVMDLQGNIREEYWNSGHIYNISLVDIDNDEIKEIIFGGTNNDYDQAILGVLEYGSVSGHSPQEDPDYVPSVVPTGNQRYYIRFPHLHPTIMTLSDNARLSVTEMYDLGDEQIEVITSDGFTEFTGLFFTISYNMSMQKFGFSDGFLNRYFQKYGRNLYDDFTPEFITEYFSKPEYWDGEDWVTEPAENKYWKQMAVE